MRVARPNLPDLVVSETQRIAVDLTPALDGATIAICTWSSTPDGLVFASDSITGGEVSVSITGRQTGQFVIEPEVTLSTGAVRIPWLRIKVKEAGII